MLIRPFEEWFSYRRKNMADTAKRVDLVGAQAKALTERYGNQIEAGVQTVNEKAREVTFQGVVETVKDKLHDVTSGASELASKARDTAQDWASSVGDTAMQAKGKAQEVATAVGEKADGLAQDASALIRRYPFQALLVGVGFGFLLGQVMRHSSSARA
jgi:ElaB/YqjD/DUF883 family membrane-anchored ribosome-binding protein